MEKRLQREGYLSVIQCGEESMVKMLITIVLQYLMRLQRYDTHLRVCKFILQLRKISFDLTGTYLGGQPR